MFIVVPKSQQPAYPTKEKAVARATKAVQRNGNSYLVLQVVAVVETTKPPVASRAPAEGDLRVEPDDDDDDDEESPQKQKSFRG